jgi:hypothetical protein
VTTGLWERVLAVLRLDWSIYQQIEDDPHAIPQAFLVVAISSALAAFGQGGFSSFALLAVAGWIVWWGATTALMWLAGLILIEGEVDYVKLLRCTGFASAWRALALFEGLWLIGGLIFWAALALWLVALVAAAREALDASTPYAVAICVVALALPAVLIALIG